MTRRGAVTWMVVALTVVVLLAAALAWQARKRAAALAERETGSALFHGNLPLPGHLAVHAEVLPTLGTRCSNCHEATSSSTVQNAAPPVAEPGATGASGEPEASASGTYARRLDKEWLSQPQRRRGGPPSVYDAAALCATLRSGVDPAHVMLPTAMPRYDASAEQCGALWAYLVSPR